MQGTMYLKVQWNMSEYRNRMYQSLNFIQLSNSWPWALRILCMCGMVDFLSLSVFNVCTIYFSVFLLFCDLCSGLIIVQFFFVSACYYCHVFILYVRYGISCVFNTFTISRHHNMTFLNMTTLQLRLLWFF